MTKYTSFEQRFWTRVDVRGINDCWEWSGGASNGYGILSRTEKEISDKNERGTTANRICWEMNFGKIEKGLEVGHRCANRSCVNPKHLYITSHEENIREMADRKTRKNSYVFPAPVPDEEVVRVMKFAISEQIKYKLKNKVFIESLSVDTLYNFYLMLYEKSVITEIAKVEIMICGHSSNYIVHDQAGTNFCVMCEFLAVNSKYNKITEIVNE